MRLYEVCLETNRVMLSNCAKVVRSRLIKIRKRIILQKIVVALSYYYYYHYSFQIF